MKWLWVGVFACVASFVAAPLVEAQGYGVRVTNDGFDALSAAALELAPDSYNTPVFDTVLFDCPATERNVTAHVPPSTIRLNFHSIDLHADDGSFTAGTVFDIDVAMPIFLDNPVACFGDSECDVTASIQRLGVALELAAGTSAEGGIEFFGATVDLNLTAEDLNLESEGCVVGEVVTWLVDAFENWLLELGIPLLEEALSERITMALNDIMSDTISLEVQRDDLLIGGSLTELDLSTADGLTAGGDLSLQWTGPAVWEVPSPELRNPDGAALPDGFGPGMFQVAVSDRVVTGALYEAYRGGLIQRLLADQTLGIVLPGDGVVQQIGLEAGTALEVFMDIEEPLEVNFGREEPNVASIALNGLHVRVEVLPPSGPSSTIDVRVDGSAAAGLAVNDNLGGLVLDIERLDIDQLILEAGETTIDVDRARLAGFIRDTVTPMLAERLAGVPVAPSLNAVMGTFVHVRNISSDGGWQRVGIDMVAANPDDTTGPETVLDGLPDRIPAGTARFLVSGSDDSTPDGLLRYAATLDGTSLTMGVPSSVRAVIFDVTEGMHTFEVAAVDLNDNADATPARHEFYADGTPPELTVTESPLNIIDERVVRASWIGSDDDGQPVWSRWEVREIRSDGTTVVVGETPFAPDRFTMELDGLDRSELHELEIVVRDTAGNVTSQTFGFAITGGGGGCSTSSGAGSSAFVALALFVLVRRRRA